MSGVHVRKHKDILWLVLDNAPLNSLNVEMINQLGVALHNAIQQAPRLLVMTGAGERAFCAGVELANDSETLRADLLHAANAVSAAFRELHTYSIPTVALVKGIAFGAGCELVALCDIVIAREDARFRVPAVNAKVFLDATSVYLPAAIRQENTSRLMQSGETVLAREAMRLGLAHQVLPEHSFLTDTEELLVMLATHP